MNTTTIQTKACKCGNELHPVRIKYGYDNCVNCLLRGAEVPFTAKGSVTGKAFGLSFKVPLRHEQPLNI